MVKVISQTVLLVCDSDVLFRHVLRIRKDVDYIIWQWCSWLSVIVLSHFTQNRCQVFLNIKGRHRFLELTKQIENKRWGSYKKRYYINIGQYERKEMEVNTLMGSKEEVGKGKTWEGLAWVKYGPLGVSTPSSPKATLTLLV